MEGERQDSQAAWYVVHTKPKQEFRALQHLQNQSYVCFLPTLQARKTVRGRLSLCMEPLFSRYIFVRLDPVTCRMASLASTRGVNKLLSFGGRFATVPEDVINALQQITLMRGSLFLPGERVQVTSGPLAGLEAIYQTPKGDDRAIVLIEFLSRKQNLSVKLDQLQKAN